MGDPKGRSPPVVLEVPLAFARGGLATRGMASDGAFGAYNNDSLNALDQRCFSNCELPHTDFLVNSVLVNRCKRCAAPTVASMVCLLSRQFCRLLSIHCG